MINQFKTGTKATPPPNPLMPIWARVGGGKHTLYVSVKDTDILFFSSPPPSSVVPYHVRHKTFLNLNTKLHVSLWSWLAPHILTTSSHLSTQIYVISIALYNIKGWPHIDIRMNPRNLRPKTSFKTPCFFESRVYFSNQEYFFRKYITKQRCEAPSQESKFAKRRGLLY